ncbi:Flagellar hook-associated protein 1 [biofilm metagenome]
MSGMLGTAISGLMAFQRSMDTTSHNIANVNTEGYSRQRVDLSANTPFLLGDHYIGQGVNVAAVTRNYDQFVNNQLTSSTSAFGDSSTLATMAAKVDNIVSSEATGLTTALTSFFSAVNGVANDPTSMPARQVLVSEASTLAQQFNQLSAKFDSLRNQSNSQIEGSLDEINLYASNLAELNTRIAVETGRAGGSQLPNDLLDQRDVLINKIAEKVSVSASLQPNGTVNVFIGKGQAIVLGEASMTLSLKDSATDPSRKEVALGGNLITRDITGGELSGAIKFRDQVLDPAQQQLGLVAAGMAVQFNTLHNAGFDLNGDAGANLFSLGSPALDVPVTAKPGTVGSVTASYDPSTIGQLTPSDYELSYDGSNFALTRLSDNTVTAFAGPPPSTLSGSGFTITTSASVVANDSFVIRPTFDAAKKMTTLISDPAKIAAAGTSGGSGSPNTGDNTNALNLAKLENASTLAGGKLTLNKAYGQLVSKVGAQTHSAKVSSSAQEVLLNQVKQDRESLAGVNLDEEAANLLKFQQSYQAAAQVVSIANSLFDSLINAVRR